MASFWENFIIEIGILTFLGVLYYYYQKRKIIKLEANKGPALMNYVLHSCLAERGEGPDSDLDPIIEVIDDYLHNRIPTPPLALLRRYAESGKCSPELKTVIEESLSDME